MQSHAPHFFRHKHKKTLPDGERFLRIVFFYIMPPINVGKILNISNIYG